MRRERDETAADVDVDVEIQNEGGILLFQPLTEAARWWIEANVPDDATWFGGRLVVEHRYARDLADGMMADGLEVR